jgi:hypothetical protein
VLVVIPSLPRSHFGSGWSDLRASDLLLSNLRPLFFRSSLVCFLQLWLNLVPAWSLICAAVPSSPIFFAACSAPGLLANSLLHWPHVASVGSARDLVRVLFLPLEFAVSVLVLQRHRFSASFFLAPRRARRREVLQLLLCESSCSRVLVRIGHRSQLDFSRSRLASATTCASRFFLCRHLFSLDGLRDLIVTGPVQLVRMPA